MISVIIPNHNYALYLIDALNSVFCQSHLPMEVIVVDDASTDESDALLSSYPHQIVYLKQSTRIGAAAARNLGVERATGDYIAFLDADDLWTVNKLYLQYVAIAHHQVAEMLFGCVQNFYTPELEVSIRKRLYFPELPMQGFLPSTLMIHKMHFLEVGFFDTDLKAGEFIDWYARAQNKGYRSHVLPEVVTLRRVHAGHIGKSMYHQEYCKILRNKIRDKKLSSAIPSSVDLLHNL